MKAPKFALLLSIFLLVSTTPVGGQTSSDASIDHDDSIIININTGNGLTYNEDEIISGFIENEETPYSIWWEISDSTGIRSTGMLTDSLVPLDGDFDRNRWAFEISIITASISPCACVLIVHAQEGSKAPVQEARSIFIRDGAESLPPTILLEQDFDDSWASSQLSLTGKSSTVSGSNADLSYFISPSTESKCVVDVSNSITMSAPLGEEHSLHWGEQLFSVVIDVSRFQDGWHDLVVFASDPDSSQTAFDCISLRVDNSPPSSLISGPTSIIENDGAVWFDGSETDDNFWGRSGLTYIWTLRLVSSTTSIPLQVSSGLTQIDFAVNANISGEFDLLLTVVDRAGNSHSSSKSFTIENTPPIVRLEVSESPVFDGDTLRISKSSRTQFDASGSTDTANDVQSLRYIWRINNVPVYEGPIRDLDWPDEFSDEFYLSVEVIDDDGSSSMLTVLVSDSRNADALSSSIAVLILSIAFFSYSVIRWRRVNTQEEEIPKWAH